MKTAFALILSIALPFAASAKTTSKSTTDAKAKVRLSVKDSKQLFVQKVDSFDMTITNGTESQTYPCDQRAFSLSTNTNLHEGWDPKKFDYAQYLEEENGYAVYYFSSCRTADTQILAWYQDQHSIKNYSAEFWGEISYFFIQDDFDNTKHNLLIEKRNLENGDSQYFSCKNPITKTQTKETENYIAYDVATECDEVKSVKTKGLIDFIYNPGPWAAFNSYREIILPPVASNAENFKKVTEAFLNKIPTGTYSGIMKSGTKTCDLDVAFENDTLTIKHIITTGAKPRTRVLEFKASDLLGFVEGDVYANPIRIEETTIGTFSAAEFINQKDGKPITIRFEKNENREGQILRINGSEAYCRRLVQK